MDVYAIVWERSTANSISCCWFVGSGLSCICEQKFRYLACAEE